MSLWEIIKMNIVLKGSMYTAPKNGYTTENKIY